MEDQIEAAKYSTQKGPDFICVGPEKTGTSWLYSNLQQHPDIFLPPINELRYFFESLAYPNENWLHRLSPSGDWHTWQYRIYLRNRCKHYLRYPRSLISEWRRFRWDWRYLFSKHSDKWYLSMFDLADGRLAGEISPQYFFMPESQIIHIRKLLPKLKVITILRNPIDWCWSFTRMAIIELKDARGSYYFKDSESIEKDILEFINLKIKRCQFAPAIKRWQKNFDLEYFYVAFYDQLREKPFEFYQDICKFLDIDPKRAPERLLVNLSKTVNPGISYELPGNLAHHMARGWEEDLKELNQLFPKYTKEWKLHFDKLIARK